MPEVTELPYPSQPVVETWLAGFLARSGAAAGSVYLARSADELVLVAACNLPESILAAAAIVPAGKGLAGIAAQRREPVVTTDLQTDDSGCVRPGALASRTRGSVTMPVFAESGALAAVVGLGFPDVREFTEAEIAGFLAEAEEVRALGVQPGSRSSANTAWWSEPGTRNTR